MKKVLLCIMIFAFVSCASDDDGNSTTVNSSAISFNLNGVDYRLTDYTVMIDPTNNMYRVVEASFDDDTKRIRFNVLVEETNAIYEFALIINDVYYMSDPNLGNRETSITTHTDTKMEGTFRVTIEDTFGNSKHVITNGIIDIEY